MARRTFPVSGEATAQAERIVAWLRLPAIALIALSQGLPHPNPSETAFLVTLAAFSAWSAGVLAWVYLRPVSQRLALAATAVDIAAITALAVLSGGPFSHVRLAFFIVPVAVAFRFRPSVTAVAVVVTTAAYVVQAVAHPARSEPQAARFILTQAGFIAWVGVACVLLSAQLARRTELVSRLAEAARACSPTRRRPSSGSARRSRRPCTTTRSRTCSPCGTSSRKPARRGVPAALDRADDALAQTIGQLRDAVFDLHPYVLDEAGLEAALRSLAQRTATRAQLALQLHLEYPGRHPQEQLLYSAARELLANVVQHAEAAKVEVALAADGGELQLVVADDGRGFSPDRPAEALADGHVGLASQRVRIEAVGGTLDVTSDGGGTRAEIRMPV